MITQAVPPLRRSAGLCNSGTIPGQVTAPCKDPDTRPYPAGPRCDTHRPFTVRPAP